MTLFLIFATVGVKRLFFINYSRTKLVKNVDRRNNNELKGNFKKQRCCR
nr:MAG TPA: hypothetical protein [Caudoviricetes sp.]